MKTLLWPTSSASEFILKSLIFIHAASPSSFLSIFALICKFLHMLLLQFPIPWSFQKLYDYCQNFAQIPCLHFCHHILLGQDISVTGLLCVIGKSLRKHGTLCEVPQGSIVSPWLFRPCVLGWLLIQLCLLIGWHVLCNQLYRWCPFLFVFQIFMW